MNLQNLSANQCAHHGDQEVPVYIFNLNFCLAPFVLIAMRSRIIVSVVPELSCVICWGYILPSASLSLILSNNSKSQFPCKFGIRVQHYALTFNLYKQLIVMHNVASQVWKQAHRLWVMLIEFEDEVSCRQIVCDFILCYNYSC